MFGGISLNDINKRADVLDGLYKQHGWKNFQNLLLNEDVSIIRPSVSNNDWGRIPNIIGELFYSSKESNFLFVKDFVFMGRQTKKEMDYIQISSSLFSYVSCSKKVDWKIYSGWEYLHIPSKVYIPK